MDMETLLNELSHPPRAFPPVLESAVIRTQPEDFQVDELPAYLPDGTGQHLYLWVEKRNVEAGDMVSQLSRLLQVNSRDIGVAGLKDRRAVTRQFVSVPRSCESRLPECETPDIKILSVSAHGNKLRTGHLQGNRFRIVLRAPADTILDEQAAGGVNVRLAALEEVGFPNYFGPQRFGHHGNSVRDGLALIGRHGRPPRWRSDRRRSMKRLAASAIQSAVFNLVLAQRVADGTFSVPNSGDVVCGRHGIRPFLFDERGDTSAADVIPMGPMPGPKMLSADGHIRELEQSVLQKLKLTNDDFAVAGRLTPGVRRRLVAYPANVSSRLRTDCGIEVQFELPAGSFATVLLAEICGALFHATDASG